MAVDFVGFPISQLRATRQQVLRRDQQTLTITPIEAALSWLRNALAVLADVRFFAAVPLAVGLAPAAFAQPQVIRCLLPEVPVTDLPAAVLAEYRAEIAAEFEAYFVAVSTHIACLDAERDRTLAAARIATEAYSTFLNTPSAQKDFP